MTAATSDNGIAVALISADRQSKRNTANTMITSTQPISMEWLRLAIERSMNVAGRKIVVS